MKRIITGAVLLLTLGVAFGAAPGDDLSSPRRPETNMGTLKLFPSKESVGVLLNAESPPRVFLDGEFVGNYGALVHDTPACFRLPAGKHTVRVEFGSEEFPPFESKIFLIGNDTTQFLCVTVPAEGCR